MERGLLAKLGAIVFGTALLLPTILAGAGAQASTVLVASAVDVPIAVPPVVLPDAPGELPEIQPPVSRSRVFAASIEVEAPAPQTVAPVVVAPSAPPPPPEPLVADGVVVASWYGPDFYGNRTACGHTYTPEILGVAHRTLPCGTQIRITSPAGMTAVAAVIDRGPFVAGRHLDLSNALKLALRCNDLCRVHMAVVP